MGNFLSVAWSHGPGGCSHSHVVMAAFLIMAHSSPENKNSQNGHEFHQGINLLSQEVNKLIIDPLKCFNSLFRFWTPELVSGTLTKPISPPLIGTSVSG
jgi:hypothetical protein